MIPDLLPPSCKQHTDVYEQASLLTINTAVLASEIFKQIPEAVPHFARSLLSFTGMTSLNLQVDELLKRCTDFKHAWQEDDWKIILFTAAKVSVKALDIFFTIGTFTFAIVALAGNPAAALTYYALTKPLAMSSWFLMIAIDFIDHYQNRQLLQELKQSPSHTLTNKIARQLDNYQLEMLEKVPKKQFSKLLIETVETKQTVTHSDLALKALGYISLGINRAYPLSVIEASTTWGISVLYSALLAYKKYQTFSRLRQ